VSTTGGSRAVDPPAEQEQGSPAKSSKSEEIDFENEDFTIPPSFGQELTKESLKDDDHIVLWDNLKIPLPEKPGQAADTMFDCLADFIKAAGEEDKKFIVFPYNLSQYKSVLALPQGVVDLDSLPEEIDEWLPYFLIYTAMLIGLSMPFVMFIKKLSPWCKEKRFGLCKVSLQSEKPALIGWLLFSTNTMDPVLLKEQIMESIQDIPVGLHWKMISMGTQGQVKEEDQVWVLHLFIDELDVRMAKPLLTNLYPSWLNKDHAFPLHIWMQLVLEINLVLNINGGKM